MNGAFMSVATGELSSEAAAVGGGGRVRRTTSRSGHMLSLPDSDMGTATPNRQNTASGMGVDPRMVCFPQENTEVVNNYHWPN